MKTEGIRSPELVLREELALERTKMARYRTFLAFMRTALYFPVAGISMHEALELSYGIYLQWAGIAAGIIILITGLSFNYFAKRRIRKYGLAIGGNLEAFDPED